MLKEFKDRNGGQNDMQMMKAIGISSPQNGCSKSDRISQLTTEDETPH